MKNHMTFRYHFNFANRALLVLFVIGLITSPGNSQTTTSLTLRLSVVDTQGSVVPGATVVLNRQGTDYETTGVTSDNGIVTFADLQPGTNKVKVKATGFVTLEQSVTVSVNRTNALTLAIEPIPIGTMIASAEDADAIERGDAPKDAAKEDDKCAGDVKCKVNSIRLGWAGRFARGFQYEYKLTEQPGTVLISSGADRALVTAFLRNPQHYLQQHTLNFKFAELIPDRSALFRRGSDYLKKYPQAGYDPLLSSLPCEEKTLITCLTNGGRWWERLLMGTSINFSFPERADISGGFFVTDPRFGKKYQFNFGFTFDPAKLFPNATNWRSTFEDVQKTDQALALLAASDAIPGTPWKTSLAAALIPKVELKMVSQFDFVKDNGVLIEAPFPERAINTWTFTWDLTRVIPDTKTRADADAITAALASLGRTPPPQKKCTLHFSSEADRVLDVHPASTRESCRKLAQLLKADSFEFGVP